MKYVIICSKGVYPSVNSFWSYTFFKGKYPDEVLILYRDGDDAAPVERAVRTICEGHGRNVSVLRKKLRGRTREEIRKEVLSVAGGDDIVDITGATKYELLSLLGTGLKAYYLHLEGGEFRDMLFLKKPLSLQRTLEVVL
jgi:hypothetical protein